MARFQDIQLKKENYYFRPAWDNQISPISNWTHFKNTETAINEAVKQKRFTKDVFVFPTNHHQREHVCCQLSRSQIEDCNLGYSGSILHNMQRVMNKFHWQTYPRIFNPLDLNSVLEFIIKFENATDTIRIYNHTGMYASLCFLSSNLVISFKSYFTWNTRTSIIFSIVDASFFESKAFKCNFFLEEVNYLLSH